MTCQCEPVGIPEIADRLGVRRRMVDTWRYRGRLPPARWTVGGGPAWNWPDIAQWAADTNRGHATARGPVDGTE